MRRRNILVRSSEKFKIGVALCLLTLSLSDAVQSQQASSKTNVLAAENHIKQKNFAQAIEILESVIALDPRSTPEAYVMLAVCRVNVQEKEKAVETCERGIQVYPNSDRLKEFYIRLLEAAVEKSEAKAKLFRHLQRHPDSVIYQKALGQLLMAENPQNPEAERLLATAAKASPQDAEAHYFYGQYACLNNKDEICIAELAKAGALAPTNDQANMQIYTQIGMAEDRLNRPAKAEAAFQLALKANQKLTPPNPQAAFQYVEFLVKRAREAEAQKMVDELLRWAPTFGPAHFERAKFLARQKKMEEAIAEGKLALQYSDDDKTRLRAIHSLLAKTYFAMGRLTEAKVHQSWLESPH